MIGLGLKSVPVPLGHIAGNFHIETEEGTYRGRFLAPVTVKSAAEPEPQKPVILMQPQVPEQSTTLVGQAFGHGDGVRFQLEGCA